MKPSSLVLDCGSSVVVTSGWSSMITTPTVTNRDQVSHINFSCDEYLEPGMVSQHKFVYLLA